MATNMQLLGGTYPVQQLRLPLFSPTVLDFLEIVSQEIRHDPQLRAAPSYAAFSFWLRRKHLESFRKKSPSWPFRLGRGCIFHIAPTNLPIMFAYSLVISMLAGNSNIIRISARALPDIAPLLQLIDMVWKQPAFKHLDCSNAFIKYDHDKAITDYLSGTCDGRIIWGGDESIRQIRQSPLPPQAIELAFADRYSIAIINSPSLSHLDDENLWALANRFYNDTYDMDQNACSSPQLIFWLDSPGTDGTMLRHRWWTIVAKAAKKYDLSPIKISHKYTHLWSYAMNCPHIQHIDKYEQNLLYVYTLSSLPKDITGLSGQLGQFFQYTIQDLEQIIPYVSKKIQTISTVGIDRTALRQRLLAAGAPGGDRIVPFGQAMEMDILWDGVNMLEWLSRMISQE